MKIEQFTGFDESDGRGFLAITIDGKRVASFCDGEPEDNSLGRNFNDCFKLLTLLQKVHEAGKNFEPLEVKRTELSWDEYCNKDV